MRRIRDEIDQRSIPESELAEAVLDSPTERTVARRRDQLASTGRGFRAGDLLGGDVDEFLRNAYRSILQREADESGLTHYRSAIASGRLTRVEVLGRLRLSGEGRRKGVRVRGLMPTFLARSLMRIRLLGYPVAVVAALFRLPTVIPRLEAMDSTLDVQRRSIDELATELARLQSKHADVEARDAADTLLGHAPGQTGTTPREPRQ
jgi:O-antigen chain-terminating methyltransferase